MSFLGIMKSIITGASYVAESINIYVIEKVSEKKKKKIKVVISFPLTTFRFYSMGHRRSKNQKGNLKSRTIRSASWSKESDANLNKSESALERFLFSLFCFQWFCNRRKSNEEVEDDNDTLSTHSSYQVKLIVETRFLIVN